MKILANSEPIILIREKNIMMQSIIAPMPFENDERNNRPQRGDYDGFCPLCNSPLVWRKAEMTGELYRGCTNYDGGCRYQERSY